VRNERLIKKAKLILVKQAMLQKQAVNLSGVVKNLPKLRLIRGGTAAKALGGTAGKPFINVNKLIDEAHKLNSQPTGLKHILRGAGVLAVPGAIAGAVGGGEGNRGKGALVGALGGAATGAALAPILRHPKVMQKAVRFSRDNPIADLATDAGLMSLPGYIAGRQVRNER